jgi:DNA polymerase epsilon subunit 1
VFRVDEASGCSKAFGMLKTLLSRWATDYGAGATEEGEGGNKFADVLITHFYRWLSNTRSLLYDPAIHRYVQLLMRKVFLHLIAQFKHLGGTIVYATFNKIIISTNKSELESAEQYMNYVLGETKQNPLFMWLDLEPRQFWYIL